MSADGLDGFTPFPRERAARYRDAGYWSGRTVDSLLSGAAARWPDRLAVAETGTETCSGTGYRYAELDRLVDAAAGTLAARGVTPGDRMLLSVPNGVTFAVALFGLIRAGAIPVLCLPGHGPAELGHFADVSGAVGMVAAETPGFDRAATAQLVAARPALRHVIDAAGLTDRPVAAPPRPAVDTEGPALLLASGGTTGLPKLIPRTHDDYVYTATASAELCELTDADVYLAALPAAHNFPLACPGLLGAVSVGAATVFATDPSPEAAFAAIARHGVTVTALVPPLARLWAAATAWEPVAPASLRLLQVGGAKLTAEDARQIRTALTPGLQQVFGMAEGLLCFTRVGDPADLVDNTQGRPLCPDDELQVVDDDGVEVPIGTDGELMVRGPYTINGYFANAAANRASFDDGFYRSGDRVRIRGDGYLEVTGRVKDVVNRAGETVAAAELEQHLATHPAIRAAAVVGLPDPHLGERVCAAVVFGQQPVDLSELRDYLHQRGVAGYARPDQLLVLPSLPVTAAGKVDKKAIVAAHAGR